MDIASETPKQRGALKLPTANERIAKGVAGAVSVSKRWVGDDADVHMELNPIGGWCCARFAQSTHPQNRIQSMGF